MIIFKFVDLNSGLYLNHMVKREINNNNTKKDMQYISKYQCSSCYIIFSFFKIDSMKIIYIIRIFIYICMTW